MATQDDTVKIAIKKRLALKLRRRLKETDFKTLSEYVNFILAEVVSSLEEQDQADEAEVEPEYSREEEEKVKARLRDLGYLD